MYPRQNTSTIIAVGLLLYLLTIIADVVSIAFRYWIGSTLSQIVVSAIAPASAQTFPSYVVGLIFAFAPVAWGIIALLGWPSGSTLIRYELQGRVPNAQERKIVEHVLAELVSLHPGTLHPRTWLVSTTIEPDTLAIGTTLYIRSDLLQRDWPYLTASLAHALGHLNMLDSRLMEALKRLKIRVVYLVVYALDSLGLGAFKRRRGLGFAGSEGGCFIALLEITLTLIAGGLGLQITSPLWHAYFQSCEYAADKYAVSLGQGEALARLVDNLNPPLDVPFEWMWNRTGTSQYAQKRLALLLNAPGWLAIQQQAQHELDQQVPARFPSSKQAPTRDQQPAAPPQKTKEQWLDESKALLGLQRYEEAISACEQALHLDPTIVLAYNIKGFALLRLKRYGEAMAACEQALCLDPNKAVACVNKGIAFEKLGKRKEAQQAYEKARQPGYRS